jgi:hypothetical protein
MVSRFTDADAAFQQALAVLSPEQQQPLTLNLRCRILLEQGIMHLAASKTSSQSSKVPRLNLAVKLRNCSTHAAGFQGERLPH